MENTIFNLEFIGLIILHYLYFAGIVLVHYAPLASGTILPVIVQLVNNNVRNESRRTWIAFGICIFTGILVRWDDIQTGDSSQVIMTIGLLYTESELTFKNYFKNSQLRDWIKSIYRTNVMEPVVIEDHPELKG